MGLWIVGSGQPDIAAAVECGVKIRPGVQSRVAWLHGNRVKSPLQLSRPWIVRSQCPRLVRIIPGPDEHMIADDQWRGFGKKLFPKSGRLLMPSFPSRTSIQRDEVVVGRLPDKPPS